jgi:hypothetical protein
VRNGGFWVNLGAGIRSGSTMTATRRLTATIAFPGGVDKAN